MNEELIVKPRNDVVFKTMFIEHTDLLIDFLSYAIDIPAEEIADIVITNPELVPGAVSEKFAKLDLVITQPNGTKINIEMQNHNEGDYKERSVFNCSKIFTKDIYAGDEYKDIPRTICINIVQFPLFKNSDCVCTVYPTIQETGEIVTNKWEIIYFQTSKLPKDKQGGLWDWLKLFTINTREELENMENTMTSGVKRATVILKQMNADDRMQEIARIHEKAKMAEYSALKKSREEGRMQTLKTAVNNMLAANLPTEQIAKFTGISVDEVIRISNHAEEN